MPSYTIESEMVEFPATYTSSYPLGAISQWADNFHARSIRAGWMHVRGGKEAMYWDIVIVGPGVPLGARVRVHPYGAEDGTHKIEMLGATNARV